MKKIFFFFLLMLLNISSISAYTYEEAIQEVADAYVNKSHIISENNGGLIQYDSHLKKFNISPEDAQIDKIQFTVCSNVIYQIYKETFGVSIPFSTKNLVDYAKNRSYDTTNKNYNKINTSEVKYASNVYSKDKKNNGLDYATTFSKITDKKEFYDKFVAKYGPQGTLRVGDILVFRWQKTSKDSNGNMIVSNESGHALMVYSINEQTGNVVLVEAYVNNNDSDKKYTGSLTLNKKGNSIEKYIVSKTNLYERAISFLKKQNPKKNSYLTKIAIIRPMEGNEKNNIDKPLNVNNEYLNNIKVTPATKTRLENKGLILSKTSSAHYGVVKPGEIITYTLKFKNNSNKDYTLPTITENYDLNLVKIDVDSVRKIKSNSKASRASVKNGNIIIEGIKVKAGKEVVITYNVIVKDSSIAYLNSKIISYGKVGNISNATITDTVGYKLNSNEENKFNEAIKNTSKKKTGIAYINDIYINFYKKMNIKKSTVLYGGISGSDIKLYHFSKNDSGKNIAKGLLNSNNKLVNQSYLRALGKYSITDYHSVYSYYNSKSISDFITSNKWDSNTSFNVTKKWDERKKTYPLENNLVDGDIIWIADFKNSKNEYKEYVFLYFNGKIHSNYNEATQFSNGTKIKDIQEHTSKFLANLESFRAYAVFRPIHYYGIEIGTLKLKDNEIKNPYDDPITDNIINDNEVNTNPNNDRDNDDYNDNDIINSNDNLVDGTYIKDETESIPVDDDKIIQNINLENYMNENFDYKNNEIDSTIEENKNDKTDSYIKDDNFEIDNQNNNNSSTKTNFINISIMIVIIVLVIIGWLNIKMNK